MNGLGQQQERAVDTARPGGTGRVRRRRRELRLVAFEGDERTSTYSALYALAHSSGSESPAESASTAAVPPSAAAAQQQHVEYPQDRPGC